jgi:hypothetical protein
VLSDHTDVDGATIFRQACAIGPGGHRVEAPERAVPVGPVAGLDQGEEPGLAGYDQGAGGGVVIGLLSMAQIWAVREINGLAHDDRHWRGRRSNCHRRGHHRSRREQRRPRLRREFAMREAEAIVKALDVAGYQIIRRRT